MLTVAALQLDIFDVAAKPPHAARHYRIAHECFAQIERKRQAKRDLRWTRRMVASVATAFVDYQVGKRHGRFGCPIVRVEWRASNDEQPKWFKGPSKRKGEWAIHFGQHGCVYAADDMTQPDPALDAETMEAWRAYHGVIA